MSENPIHFHLAENRRDQRRPFAFLVTCPTKSPEKARVQYRPLGLALRDAAERGAGEVEALLGPIRRAAAGSEFLAGVVASKAIFRPIYLDADGAFAVLRDFEGFGAAGIVCKVPEWWQKGRPPRPKLKVEVGGKKNRRSFVGVDGMVGFDVAVAIGEEELSAEEIMELLRQEGRFLLRNGRYIEVDREKLQALVNSWKEAVEVAQQGEVPLGQALRWLAGFQISQEKGEEEALPEEVVADRDWCEVIAGQDLQNILSSLRAPQGDLPEALGATLATDLKATLRPYQKSGVAWLNTLRTMGLGGCLADDMGLGKTIQVISLLLGMRGQGTSLLVVPTSLLGNWQNELRKFAPSIKWRVIHGSGSVAPLKDGEDLDLVITTYGMLVRLDWLKERQWNCAFADEAQAIKNAGTRQSKAVRSIKAASRFAMTGTPVENHLRDLWSIYDFVCPGLLGSERRFKEAVKGLEAAEPPDYEPLRSLVSPYLLRRKKSDKSIIADLPDKVEVKAACQLTKKQATLYLEQLDKLSKALAESEGIARKGVVLASLTKFKQICNHPSQYLQDDAYVEADSGKLQKLKEIAELVADSGEKMLVFSQYREITDVLAHTLSKVFGREGLVLHGATHVKKRQEFVEQFQSPDGPPFFVLSLKAGGTGLTLTAASHVVHFDRWWNPAVENQATDRAYRIGQKRNVLIHKFVCQGTIEERIDDMLNDKQQLADSIIEGAGEIKLTELSDEALLSLVRLDISALEDSD